jgi:hypothetical protein
VGVFMVNPALTYDDIAEVTAFMADQLLAAQNQVHDLTQQLAAAQGEVAALRGALGFEQQRSRELRNRGDHWQIVAAEAPPRLGHLPVVTLASPLEFFRKLCRAARPARGRSPQPLLLAFRSSSRGQSGGSTGFEGARCRPSPGTCAIP